MTTMKELVPADSLFRKADKYIDFTFIYEEVKDLYCVDNGRFSIDSVVLFKLVFIQALDGIKSLRQTCKKIKGIDPMNITPMEALNIICELKKDIK